jgi:hypothetical protein
VRRLTSKNSPSDNALGILNRNASLAALNQHHESDNRHDYRDKEDHHQWRPVTRRYFLIDLQDRAGQPDNDSGKDDQRHSVPDSALGDLFAKPHDECGSAVSVIIVIRTKPTPGCVTMPGLRMNAMAIAID